MDTVNVLGKDLRNVIKKEVDFLPGAWCEFFDDVTMLALEEAQLAKDNRNINTSLILVMDQISDWNFADELGNKLPVNIDSLKKLPMKLIKWLTEAETAIFTDVEDKKKVSPESSSQQ